MHVRDSGGRHVELTMTIPLPISKSSATPTRNASGRRKPAAVWALWQARLEAEWNELGNTSLGG